MDISKEFIDQFLDIVNLRANSKVRSKSGYGKFSISEILMDYRNHETDFRLIYTELDKADRSKELDKHECFKIKFIGNDSSFKSEFYKRVIEWFIFSKTVFIKETNNRIKGASDLINYGIGK